MTRPAAMRSPARRMRCTGGAPDGAPPIVVSARFTGAPTQRREPHRPSCATQLADAVVDKLLGE
jgi:hypothetical protein